jgi:rhodanese-related sulfurtransferase
MALFGFMGGPDINEGVERWKRTPGAVLVDVREREEYRQGRVPGSRNVPLSALQNIVGVVKDKGTPLFVYCLSGARSRQAVAQLQAMGYREVTNIGGINRYKGEQEL